MAIRWMSYAVGAPHFASQFDPDRVDAADGVEHYWERHGDRLEQAWSDFVRKPHPAGGAPTIAVEGDAMFTEFVCCSLRDADRWLFLAGAKMAPWTTSLRIASAHWLLVSLYYAAFSSANAISHMLGVVPFRKKRLAVGVVRERPGSQAIAVEKLPKAEGGSHGQFWDDFYMRAERLAAILPEELEAHSFALQCPEGEPHWLSGIRNRYNYQPSQADVLRQSARVVRRRPLEFSGDLERVARIAAGLFSIGIGLRRSIGLETDLFGEEGGLVGMFKNVLAAPPDVEACFVGAALRSLVS
jgi:hypothetical protein